MGGSAVSLFDELTTAVTSAPLSQILPLALRLARELGNGALEKWVRLEMDGYFRKNPAFADDVEVPEYRTVTGQHLDESGRPLMVDDSRLAFINSYRLRHGVSELEQIRNSSEPLTIHSPHMVELLRDTLHVEVIAFSFSPIAVSGVLSGIRSRLSDWLYEIRPGIDRRRSDEKPSETEESGSKTKVLVAVITGLLGIAAVVTTAIIGPVLVARINATPTPTVTLTPTPSPTATSVIPELMVENAVPPNSTEVFNVALGSTEVIVGAGYRFNQSSNGCSAFLIRGPGQFTFIVSDGTWVQYRNILSDEQAESLLQGQIGLLVDYYNCAPSEVNVSRLP